ncbi:MAG: ribose-5-phosphate isomerase RpiA [Longimonas sp.]|uniref:ribose-5-phosphate isomerase RpiA n=1 Tax=Longimonas sp. TaxID=2039626 RepID=UPI003358EDA1
MSDASAAKQAAGSAAADLVESGMMLGLGTGSTTACALEALGVRIQKEALDVVGVPTSFAAERLAHQYGIPLTTLDDTPRLDLALDGADEVDPQGRLIKGRGAAHTREKVVAHAAERFVVLIDPSKEVDTLGSQCPVPIEVVPMAVGPVQRLIGKLGGRPELRMGQAKDGPVITDQALWIIDAHFDGIEDPEALSRTLNDHPGILDHGLFLGMATDVICGEADGNVTHTRP